MTEQNTFKTVMRGYDPAEVDRRIEELGQAVTALTQQRDGLSARVEELHHEASAPSEPPSYDHLGARVAQILSLADSEAGDLRQQAADEAEAVKAAAVAESAQARRIVEDARAEVALLARQRDGITAELGQLSGVIQALAVPTPTQPPPPQDPEP